MKARTIGVAAIVVVALAIVGAAIGIIAATGDDAPPAGDARSVGAQQVVNAIGAKWPLPNPRDTSDGCKAKAGDSTAGCTSRVTTDAVTVTEYADEQTAKRAASLGKASGARQAGRYVLTWQGDQELTSEEARADMVTIAKGL